MTRRRRGNRKPKTYTPSQIFEIFASGSDLYGGGRLNRPRNAFQQVSIVYACITAIATNAARVPIRLSKGEAAGTRNVWGLKSVRWGPAAKRTR